MQAIGWYLSRRSAEVQKTKWMGRRLLQLSERSNNPKPEQARGQCLCLNWSCRCSGGVDGKMCSFFFLPLWMRDYKVHMYVCQVSWMRRRTAAVAVS